MSIARLAALPAMLGMVSCSIADEPSRLHTTFAPPVSSGTVTVVDRRPLLPTWPCSRCHGGEQGREPDKHERKLTEFHTQKVLDHGTQGGWCYRCHTADDIDHLHLSDGTKVGFNEAYELCGSCHGDKLRDWRAGIHGLTTGFWLGDRERRSCPACHDPHQPRFPLMTPEHAPARPRTAPVERRSVGEDSHGEER
ncbi:MAG TPA: hypothetical protein VIF09_06890 [Polyangiaceae bacterium]